MYNSRGKTDRSYASHGEKVSLWLVGSERRAGENICTGLTGSRLISIEKCFSSWQSAVQALRLPSVIPPRVCVLDGACDRKKEFGWLSFFKSVTPAIATILLMGDMTDENLLTALGAGLSGYLKKPCSLEQVSTAIMTVVHGEVAMSPIVLDRLRELVLQEPDTASQLLTEREKDVLTLVVEGYSSQKIADKLFISYFTVDTHLKHIYSKLEVKKRSTLVSVALRKHIISLK